MSSTIEPSTEPPNQPQVGQPSQYRRRILNWLVLGVVGVTSVLGVTALAGGIAQSTAVLLITLLLAVIGISAGATAAKLRKQHKFDDAIFAYRIAVWCLFLALIQVPDYYREKEHKRFDEEFAREREEIKKHYRLESEQ
jgi:hypothetical protein